MTITLTLTREQAEALYSQAYARLRSAVMTPAQHARLLGALGVLKASIEGKS